MENQLPKRYGLFTAICMVVGIVIGSGVFFKAQDILRYTNGNMLIGILAWLIGGAVMIVCALNFAALAQRHEKVNGIVDYAEATLGDRFAYFLAWFLSTLYYPAMTAVLAWVSARYTLVLFGHTDSTGGLCLSLAGLYLCLSYALNVLSPALTGRLQVSATAIKLVPLVTLALVGTAVGLLNGNTVQAFTATPLRAGAGGLFSAVSAAIFAYEGWIIATAINAELKNARRNLPIALILGGIVTVCVYVVYFIGLVGEVSVDTLMQEGATAAFYRMFGRGGGSLLNAFVVVSCLGTLNGLMLGTTRGIYAIAARGRGPKPDVFARIDPATKMPMNSAVFGLLLCSAWLFYYYGATLTSSFLTVLSFDGSELPIITIYGFYLPIFVWLATSEYKAKRYKRMILPCLGIPATLFMLFVAVYAHGLSPLREGLAVGKFDCPILFYSILFVVVMAIGAVFYRQRKSE